MFGLPCEAERDPDIHRREVDPTASWWDSKAVWHSGTHRQHCAAGHRAPQLQVGARHRGRERAGGPRRAGRLGRLGRLPVLVLRRLLLLLRALLPGRLLAGRAAAAAAGVQAAAAGGRRRHERDARLEVHLRLLRQRGEPRAAQHLAPQAAAAGAPERAAAAA